MVPGPADLRPAFGHRPPKPATDARLLLERSMRGGLRGGLRAIASGLYRPSVFALEGVDDSTPSTGLDWTRPIAPRPTQR